MTVFTAIIAVLLDQWLGEPRRWHPLVGFGRMADRVELYLNQEGSGSRFNGLLALSLLIIPAAAISWMLSDSIGLLFDLLVLYLALGAKSLGDHARAVVSALEFGNLKQARKKVALIVSRETGDMNETEVTRATIESVLENGADAIFGVLFWFLIAGAPGVVVYRLANTLDAMWGYRTPRFNQFGEFTAHLDDLLNWIPARLTAFSYGAAGEWSAAMRCWRTQSQQLSSPNAGPVMTSGAGALGIELGGPASYHGELKQKPFFGLDKLPQPGDIYRALDLVNKSLVIWLVAAIVGDLLFA